MFLCFDQKADTDVLLVEVMDVRSQNTTARLKTQTKHFSASNPESLKKAVMSGRTSTTIVSIPSDHVVNVCIYLTAGCFVAVGVFFLHIFCRGGFWPILVHITNPRSLWDAACFLDLLAVQGF